MKTIRDRLTDALVASGEHIVPARTQKYLVYTRKAGGYWFLGKSGALRYGECASGSFSASDRLKAKILGETV
jgi:hypothetical protein